MSIGPAALWVPRPAERSGPHQLAVLFSLLRHRTAIARPRQRLVVVGNGMVGQRFCERLVELDARNRYEIIVLSEEALPAYDRVHLSDVIRGRSGSELVLRKFAWYTQHGILLCLQQRMVGLDLASRAVLTEDGTSIGYDKLVLATGSHAVQPKIPLGDGAAVMLYRTLEDAENILCSVRSSSQDLPVAVIGAGLLGLEAARAFQLLGRGVVLLEASSQLLPRQLDHEAAAVLERTLSQAGLELRTRCSIESIERSDNALDVRLQGGQVIRAGLAVAAVGARANDDVARAAGLRCHARGGIEVDAQLRSSDPHVFAIGECGSHVAVPHGLVAPGYVMANVLAERLMGKRRKLEAQSAVTRLKLDLCEVTVIGDPVRASASRDLTWNDAGNYRRLVIKDERISAAICLGAWDELAEVQSAAAAGRKLPAKALALFEAEGRLGLSSARAGVATWPDDAVVCQCTNVTCGALRRAALSCPGDPDALSRATGASSLCGSCRPLLVTLSGSASEPARSARARVFGVAAGAALVFSALTLLAPPVPLAESVLDQGLDRLWIEPLFKQLSGFTVVALMAFGLLFSLRKHVARFRVSSYASLRVVHGVLGALALIGLFAHTGLRLGSNLNLVLMSTFLISALSGALAGLGKTLSPERLPRLSKATAYIERAHEVTFWALPALVVFHAFKTYYF